MMYFFNQRGLNRSAIRFGCISLIALVIVVYFFLTWMYSWPWWVIAGMVGIAAIINWRAVYDTGKNFLALLTHNPIGGILVGLMAAAAYPLFAIYLVLKSLGMRKFEQVFQSFNQQRKPVEEEFTAFEEVESRPLNPPPSSSPEMQKPPEAVQKPSDAKKPENPYDDFFGG